MKEPASAHHRGLDLVIGLCSLGLLTPLVLPLATGRVFVQNDLTWFHLPMRYLYQQALRAGDTVLWTPSILAGFYMQGEGQTGMFHPVHQLLYRLLPLGPAFNLELIGSYPLAFGGMYWFLRRLEFSVTASLWGAMLFAFSGFTLLHHHHMNMVEIVAHLPWLLAAADVAISDDRPRAQALGFAAVALILASELLLGFPQAVWWTGLALSAYAVFRASELRRWRRLRSCAAALAIGVLIGAVQWLPSLDVASRSTRAGGASDFAVTYSLHPFNLLQLWSPYFFEGGAYGGIVSFHEYGIYSGAILIVSCLWVWIRRDALAHRRRLVTATTVFAAIALVLALGRYGGLDWVITHLPVLRSIRGPVRYVVLVQFALAVLAAITMDDLLAIARGAAGELRRFASVLWIPATLGLLTTLLLNTGVLPYGRHTFARLAAASAGVAIVAVVTLLTTLAGRRAAWAIPALVVVTALDLGAWGIRFVYLVPARTIESLTDQVPAAPQAPADSYAFVQRHGPYSSDLLVLRGYRLTSGYVGLFPTATHPLESEAAIRLSGTRWIFTPDGSRQPFDGAAARVRLLDDSSGSARLVVDRPGRLVADVNVQGPRTLAFTERYHDGWSATADGAPVPTVPVDDDFLGCVVPPGTHEVTLRFMPRSFVYGSTLSAFGVLLLATGGLMRWRWR
jgi:hypothetical protein